jgi:3-methyladenine DNA glycosylase/8-oxoguanine DNA glycosylase
MHDPIPHIEAHHDQVRDAQRKFSALALGASHTVYHELLPAVLGQRITGLEAHRQWRALLKKHGSPAPGPRPDLICPPDPRRLAEVPYHALHQLGIERKRADTLRQVASRFDFLSRLTESAVDAHEKTTRLESIPGVGPWTSAVAGGLAFGDPDALLVGDFHVKNTVAYALTGAIRGTDDEMIETLRPYAGQRHRVVRWLQLAGWRAPARGPRRRIVSIARF